MQFEVNQTNQWIAKFRITRIFQARKSHLKTNVPILAKEALPDAGTARAVAAAGTDWGHHRAVAVAAAGHPGSGADRAGTVAGATDRRGPGWPRAMATTSLVRTTMKN